MVMLLRERHRRLSVDEVATVVAHVQGAEVARGVELVVDNPDGGMSYFEWRSGSIIHHVGVSAEPYLNRIGITKPGEPTRWIMRETVPPADPAMAEAWMQHGAWMYVDALDFQEPEALLERVAVVLRLAARFVDAGTLLIWLYSGGDETKLVALPTAEAVRSMTAGAWPGMA